MQLQGSFSQAEYASKKKQTRRDKFLAETEQVVPWPRLVARLAPLYPKGERAWSAQADQPRLSGEPGEPGASAGPRLR